MVEVFIVAFFLEVASHTVNRHGGIVLFDLSSKAEQRTIPLGCWFDSSRSSAVVLVGRSLLLPS